MKHYIALSTMAVIVFVSHSSLKAQTAVRCLSESGENVLIPVIYTHPGDFAKTRTLPNPAIYVDPAIHSFSSVAQMLIFNHECHHATHTYINEDEADVYAGTLMYKNGVSSDRTKAAALEVFRWTTANNGHSVPAVRVELVMNGYAAAAGDGDTVKNDAEHDPAQGLSCQVTENDIENADYESLYRSALNSKFSSSVRNAIASAQKDLNDDIEHCEMEVTKLREDPERASASSRRKSIRDDKEEIAVYRAAIRAMNKHLQELQ